MSVDIRHALLVRGYEVVIGIETHVQLATQSKIFSRAGTAFGADPNIQACAVDLALPGTLPVMNKKAVYCAICFGLAVDAKISHRSIFARKHYFYPDLPKGYQISQYEMPIVQGGRISFVLGSENKAVRLVRAHLEEDAGKSLHENLKGLSGIDLNRAGIPLLEIVTEPDIRSSAEAVAYAKELHKIVTWNGICNGNMQEGNFRCDANVSVRKPGAELGVRREIKNLNSFRFMQQAIDFEVLWQIDRLEEGLAIEQATVLFNPDNGETYAMRTKEDAADYRYFPDPDLPPLVIDEQLVESIKAELMESPRKMRDRFVSDYEMSMTDAEALTQNRFMALYFDSVVAIAGKSQAKLVSNWLQGEISKRLNELGMSAQDIVLPPSQLAFLLKRVHDNTLSHNSARKVLDLLWSDPNSDIDLIIEKQGLSKTCDVVELESFVEQVLENNLKNIEEFKSGKEKALNALIGQVMKLSLGKANPAQVSALLRKRINSY